MTISPPKQKIVLVPGEKFEGSIEVSNSVNSPDDIKYSVTVGSFGLGKDANGNDLPKTVISREYSSEWTPGDEPYYPVNDEKNSALYAKYKAETAKLTNVIFGGRLGTYSYYDMDVTVDMALQAAATEFAGNNA